MIIFLDFIIHYWKIDFGDEINYHYYCLSNCHDSKNSIIDRPVNATVATL